MLKKKTSSQPEILFRADLSGRGPVHAQVEHALREAVRSGRLRLGMPLPSTRVLARDLGVSRGVIVEAYEQLIAEGYLVASARSRTVVAAGASTVSDQHQHTTAPQPKFDFRPGLPDLSYFPRQAWGRAMRRALHDIHKEQPSRLLMLAAFGAVYIIWGSTYLGIKYAIETLPPFLMAGARFFIAGAVLYGWARLGFRDSQMRRERLLPSHWRTAAVIGALLFLCGNGGVTWAEGHITSSLAALLVATEPLWIVLLSWSQPGGSRPGGKVWLGLALGFAGVWLLVRSSMAVGNASGGAGILGACVVIGGAFAWAVGSIYSLRASLPRSPLLSAGMQMLAGGSMLLLTGIMTGELARLDFNSVSTRSVVAFLYLTVFGSVVAFTAYSWLLRNTSPARVSTYAYVNPAVAVLLGWALAGETMTINSLLAAGIIVASVILITSREKSGDEKAEESTSDETDSSHSTAEEVVHLR